MDSATVDSVYENLFSAQNFFAMHEQQQIDKQNSMMANNSLMGLDMFRYEDGSGDACGSLQLGEDYCSGYKDEAEVGAGAGAGAGVGSTAATNSSGSNSDITTDDTMESTGATGVTSAAVTATPKTSSLLDWQQQHHQQQQQQQQQLLLQDQSQSLSLEHQKKGKDEVMKSLDAFELHSSLNGNRGAAPPHDCLWSSNFRPARPAPTIQIGEEKFVLRTDTIFVLGMRLNVTKNDIIVFFGKIGHIKMDEMTLKPKIFVYKNKLTGRSKGEATITYTSSYAAQSAIYHLDGAKFLGQILSVVPAYLSTRPGKSVRFSYAQDPVIDQQRRQRQKKWKPAIDNWVCELCRNSNFVWRLSCNRCRVNKSDAHAINSAALAAAAAVAGGGAAAAGTAAAGAASASSASATAATSASATAAGAGAAGVVTSAAASAASAAGVAVVARETVTSGVGGQNGLWRPRKNDWTCGYCFNVNFWYRQKCNRCRAPKAELQASLESDRDKWELVVSQISVV